MSSYQTNCFNISKAWSDKREIAIRDRTVRFYHGWINIPVTIIAIPLTFFFITANIRAIKAHRVSRKFHVLLVNRSIGDILATLCSFFTIIYVLFAEHINPTWLQVFNTLFTSCFWSGLVTYTSIGLLKLYGIAEPLKYKKKVTMESWIVFLLIFAATMGFTILVKIEALAEFTGCKVENCLSYMYKVRNVLTLLLYLTTILTFIISVLLIKSAKKRAKDLNAHNTDRQQRSVRKRFRFPMIKLTLGVTTFAIFHFPYSIWNVALTFADGCYFVLHYNKMQSLLAVIRLIVLLRIIVDVVLGFFMDKEIRYQLFILFGFNRFGISTSELFSPTTTVKLSTTTNSVIISSESAPESFATVTKLDEKLKTLKEKRTVSARISGEKVLNNQHRRCSDKSEYINTKNVRF
ncbi:G_PROTEIN_RECEP_F1_2 domain-containing protein [Meloidogyne graminicola]|uniref:G_PROTEIN_RECEP_F1_2 domain-containing protein n=1 Tax=Meloidogyne graminicola TaxID=189291 RepID=A0A8S9ZPG1_9BILA|nr:G_PROTEIN_RECEP_F1_2 domain-containing protein [Meloidogyne graminicola]